MEQPAIIRHGKVLVMQALFIWAAMVPYLFYGTTGMGSPRCNVRQNMTVEDLEDSPGKRALHIRNVCDCSVTQVSFLCGGWNQSMADPSQLFVPGFGYCALGNHVLRRRLIYKTLIPHQVYSIFYQSNSLEPIQPDQAKYSCPTCTGGSCDGPFDFQT
ncbi:hypothetical protein GOP47_0029944 [Adiantum capillus-veneris]|nr:hypothetical protein GOP47_0029944 [Adiantum capillus-veneris]